MSLAAHLERAIMHDGKPVSEVNCRSKCRGGKASPKLSTLRIFRRLALVRVTISLG